MNPPGIRDMRIRLWLRKIVDSGGPASGPGTILLVLRPTFNDPVNGDMTMVDFPVSIPFTLVTGNVTFSTDLGPFLQNTLPFRFPDCTSFELLSVAILDENGNTFAVPGVRVIP